MEKSKMLKKDFNKGVKEIRTIYNTYKKAYKEDNSIIYTNEAINSLVAKIDTMDFEEVKKLSDVLYDVIPEDAPQELQDQLDIVENMLSDMEDLKVANKKTITTKEKEAKKAGEKAKDDKKEVVKNSESDKKVASKKVVKTAKADTKKTTTKEAKKDVKEETKKKTSKKEKVEEKTIKFKKGKKYGITTKYGDEIVKVIDFCEDFNNIEGNSVMLIFSMTNRAYDTLELNKFKGNTVKHSEGYDMTFREIA